MFLSQANDNDNDQLLRYFAKHHLPGEIELKIRRMFSFFNQYRIQSNDHVTYLLKNQNNEIEAMASLLFREGYIENQKEVIGFATDLRVSPTRRAVLSWSQHFLPVLEEERKKRGCNYIFSVVPHAQRQAYNTFIRPRNMKRRMPRYHLFRKFKVVSLHGLWPLHDVPLKGIRVRSATAQDKEAICEYIVRRTMDRPYKFANKASQLIAQIDAWHDLSVENFLVACDKQNNIIGCVGLWSPERVQRVYPVKLSERAQNLCDILKILSLFGIARKLPKIDQEFQLRHLTHLQADNPDIFYSLLYNSFLQAGHSEILLYPHFEGDLLTLPPRSFISAEQEFGLYCVLSPTDPIPNFLRPKSMQIPPVFEPAFM